MIVPSPGRGFVQKSDVRTLAFYPMCCADHLRTNYLLFHRFYIQLGYSYPMLYFYGPPIALHLSPRSINHIRYERAYHPGLVTDFRLSIIRNLSWVVFVHFVPSPLALLLDIIRPSLSNDGLEMMDLGVEKGRTAHYLSHLNFSLVSMLATSFIYGITALCEQ